MGVRGCVSGWVGVGVGVGGWVGGCKHVALGLLLLLFLQDQLALQQGKAGGGHQEQLLQQVKERTSYTAQQMDVAANKAEVTLK